MENERKWEYSRKLWYIWNFECLVLGILVGVKELFLFGWRMDLSRGWVIVVMRDLGI